MRAILGLLTLLAASTAAEAGCVLVTDDCSTDSSGNTYITRQNLGGGYSTSRNGDPYSTTSQTLGGSYRENYIGGGSRTYSSDPYEGSFRTRPLNDLDLQNEYRPLRRY